MAHPKVVDLRHAKTYTSVVMTLSPPRVVIDDVLVFTPTRYSEEIDDGAVIIEMGAATTDADTETLVAMIARPRDYFSVVTEGVRDTPLSMRFGKCLWEKQEDGSRMHKLVLVEASYDKTKRKPGIELLVNPELQRSMEAIASLQALVGRLVDSLVEANAIRPDDASRWRQETAEAATTQLDQFYRTDDLAKWFQHDE